MTRRPPACRWCARTDGTLLPVPMAPGAADTMRTMTASRRASVARLARLNPVVEHSACLEAETLAELAYHVARGELLAQSSAAAQAGDIELALELHDRSTDLTVAQFRTNQPGRIPAP